MAAAIEAGNQLCYSHDGGYLVGAYQSCTKVPPGFGQQVRGGGLGLALGLAPSGGDSEWFIGQSL